MAVYDANGNELSSVYDANGIALAQAYDADGNPLLNDRQPLDASVWFVNQIGYDSDKSKRATYMGNASTFSVKRSNGEEVYSGNIVDNIADLSSVVEEGNYFLETESESSYDFKIANNRTWDASAKVSLDFMSQARQDAFDVGGNTGYAWRDSHQFSFELNSLVMQYMSNPTYYNSLPYGIYKVNECEYTELRTQDCPDIIWLMKFAVTRYYDWNVNKSIQLHALIKAQVAYFLYIYPHISQYVDATWYQTIRDWLITQWSVSTCNKSWFEVSGGIDHNLFTTQAKIGTAKGMLPPGYAVVPNFMMYEVATRDGLASASSFLTSAENNIAWLVNSVDLSNPAYTKGQRMSEYITFHALTYAYEIYPSHCPSGTYTKIASVANLLISRSDNLWDYTQYQTDGDLSGATSTVWNNNESQSSGLANNPGYVGMMGVYFALARVITDTSVKAKLKELAMSHIAHGFGRNPLGRCFDYKAVDDFDGAKLGWVSRLSGGYGHLDNVVGVLDGSPKEGSFPFDPTASTGYTEGWVAFNTAWNMALAYLQGEKKHIGSSYYALGDSIVYNSGTLANPRTVSGQQLFGYTQAIETKYGTVCTNRGISDHTITQDLSTLRNINYSSVSLVTIGYGVNDGRKNVVLGTATSTDTSTFAGALRSLITKIKSDNANCNIIVLTPIQRLYVNGWGSFTENANGDTLEDFANMCLAVAESTGVYSVDLFHNSGLNESNLSSLTFDGVHPNNDGYVLMTNTIEKVMGRYFNPIALGIFANS